ncbi:hypothetical protein [Mangrovibacterium diazotrophicum]|uniref:Uncharacterized protein n=1 Tax=Mangrovibacterium diazotrophicum TaxID=1261403 RepID=A0A419W558_9BACT|nr:hypothetical protein [Mangrovibacterium diazotrophicum]RKD90566.1 hypothetical protein BC643_0906 [Mangrovibacterium diazotrophicum]
MKTKIRNKTPQSPAKWDTKSTISTIGIALIVGLIAFSQTIKPKSNRVDYLRFDQTTKGYITHIAERGGYFQGYKGANYMTSGYEISYEFSVDGVNFAGKSLVPQNEAILKIRNQQKNNNGPITVRIWYNSNNPQFSDIDLSSIN